MEPFHFKHFSIEHSNSPMAIGVDSVLLGAWAKVENTHHLLDIGTGCGLLAFMCAQKNSQCHIQGIDVSLGAITEANKNASTFPLSKQLQFNHTSLQQFEPDVHYDYIISNPPFFDHHLVQSEVKERANARHTNLLTLKDILQFSVKHLSNNGIIGMVLPFSELENVKVYSLQFGLCLNRLTSVTPKIGKPCHRILVEIGKSEALVREDEITIRDETGKYTTAYQTLTQEFYR